MDNILFPKICFSILEDSGSLKKRLSKKQRKQPTKHYGRGKKKTNECSVNAHMG